MISRIHWVGTTAALLLSLVHVFLTTRIYSALTVPALWFAGTGLALFAVALLNILALRMPTKLAVALVLVANLMTTTFMLLLYSIHPDAQVSFGIALFVVLSSCSVALLSRQFHAGPVSL
jgi:hypothetical protein